VGGAGYQEAGLVTRGWVRRVYVMTEIGACAVRVTSGAGKMAAGWELLWKRDPGLTAGRGENYPLPRESALLFSPGDLTGRSLVHVQPELGERAAPAVSDPK